MGEMTTLMARDGHEFNAYLAAPSGKPKGAIIVVQEIFGVNNHIRAVTDAYAAQGYVAIAPCLFDRIRRGIELGYTPPEMQEGIGYMMQVTPASFLADLSAALAVVRHAGRVGIVGYCWGGTLAYVAACELPVACAVAYYGGSIGQYLDKTPKRPVLYHFGEKDGHIPLAAIDKIKAVDTKGIFHMYPAGHGFNCTERADFHQPSAALALSRSLEFFAQHLQPKPKDAA
jgi:carboxymethylenebutenolidase